MITKLTLRNLRANLGRFAMTTFGVVLAVSFVVSAFVMGDGLRQTFGDLSTEIVAGVDFEVRPVDEFGSSASLTDDDVARVLNVDGVTQAVGSIEAPVNSFRPITPSGDEIPSAGPPQLAFGWVDAPGFTPFVVTSGAAPGDGQFTMDLGSAERHGFQIGESYVVLTSTGRYDLTLSGLTRFGSDNATLGATLMHVNVSEAGTLFGTSGYEAISVAVTDAARSNGDETQAAIASATGLDVLNQTTLNEETASDFNSQINIIQNVLLGFAGVALFVSIFIIGNTFAIVLKHRTREMGLLRIVGANASQLRRGAMGEAATIGLLASAAGIPGGIGVAAGLNALFGAIGAELPDYGVTLAPRTLIVALVVGLGVTLVAAWWPTRAAANVPALAALRSTDAPTAGISRNRTVGALVVGALGALTAVSAALGSGSTTATITMMAIGAVAIFGAVTMISPRLVTPVAIAFGVLLERFGMPGRLAVRNARRQSGRTATTAAALMIGLAVVSMALVVGQSVKTQLGSDLETAVQADYLLTDQAADAGFPNSVVAELDENPSVETVAGVRISEVQINGDGASIAAADLAQLPGLFELAVSEGTIEGRDDGVLVSRSYADEISIAIGDSIPMMFDSGSTSTLTVSGIFDEDAVVVQDFLVDSTLFDRQGVVASDSYIAFNLVAGLGADASELAVAEIGERYPQGELETAEQFRIRLEGLIDQILAVMNALVALAVIIALIGIANTLALSVAERTREIGLLRAVGMSKRAVRRMIRYESAVIAGFGAVLGVAMGVLLGWLGVQALPASFADTLSIPVIQILTLVVIATIAGVGAAVLPARRAGRMNVLAAINS